MGDFAKVTQFFVDSLRSYVKDASVDVSKAQIDFEEKILIKFPPSTTEPLEQKKSTSELTTEKKNVLDFSFRKFIEQLLIKSFEEDKSIMDYHLDKLLDLAILLVRKDCLEPLSIVLILEDLFDCQTVEACRELFEYVESRTQAICTLPFGRSQVFLVRTCISLLKKLSKSTNEDSLFCGKILMFLAYAVPLADKSGVNAKGEINTSNVTLWDESPVLNVDADMYRSFWSLQSLFQNISQVIQDDNKWTEFVKGVHSVCNFFEKHSLKKGVSHFIPSKDKDSFFPKYLTGSQLWSLEVEDVHFRRNILVQMMISLHTIQNPLQQPKSATDGLKDDQKTSLSDCIQRISKLLEKTAATLDEKQFLQTLQTLLQREKTWITWKRTGCQPFEKYPPKQTIAAQPLKRKQQTEASGEKRFRFANAELSRLWNLNVTEDALTSISRTHTPSLQDFLKPFEEQQKRLQLKKEQPPKPENENENNQEGAEKDPFEDEEEDEIPLQNNEVYSWKALRLVARHKLQFFSKMSKNKLQDALQLLENERKGQQIDDGNSFSENATTGNDTKMETDDKETPAQDEQMQDIDKTDMEASNDNEAPSNEELQADNEEVNEAKESEPAEIRTPELDLTQLDNEEKQENSEEEAKENFNEPDNNRRGHNNQDEQEEDIPDDVSIHDEEDDGSDPEN